MTEISNKKETTYRLVDSLYSVGEPVIVEGSLNDVADYVEEILEPLESISDEADEEADKILADLRGGNLAAVESYLGKIRITVEAVS